MARDWAGEVVPMSFCYLVIPALLANFSQETSPGLEGTAGVSRYWIKREQTVLGLLGKWAQETSPWENRKPAAWAYLVRRIRSF